MTPSPVKYPIPVECYILVIFGLINYHVFLLKYIAKSSQGCRPRHVNRGDISNYHYLIVNGATFQSIKNSCPFFFTYLFVHLNRIAPISFNNFSIYYLKSLLLAYHNRISSVGIARPEWVTTTAAATLATTTTTSCRPDRVKVDRNWCKQISGLTKTRPERCAI